MTDWQSARDGQGSGGDDPVVCGVDGCPLGWLAVFRTLGGTPRHTRRVFAEFRDLLTCAEAPAIIAVDMPIGLPERAGPGGRGPERAVRPLLGDRKSSVFSIPSRAAVLAGDYREACGIALETSEPPRKVSRQGFALFPKILEIDALMSPELESRIYEVHPELAFWRLNGEAPMSEPKKVKGRAAGLGIVQRQALLERHGFDPAFFEAPRPPRVGADDVVDAAAAAVIAERIFFNRAEAFPAEPNRDARGLRMAIWA
ncbi:DUF429 domain-containing protein [Breoghania sp. L-A4]|uniref:DUF429 domain-containing protein n=1 Tax=Breoghania sp. L-A4 TaxID=2304600 RepID=UPI000E360B3B|nr:DUF429 domain-containing protein [Breoghania sp. L-A4]AXS42272.1 DUF429 domain-containing protein [Breoghania sp. L-A4]